MNALLALCALLPAGPARATGGGEARDCIAIGLAKGAAMTVGGRSRAIAEDQPVVIDDCGTALFQKVPVQLSYVASRQAPLVLSYASRPGDEGHAVSERITIAGSVRSVLGGEDDDVPMGGQYPGAAPGGASRVKTGLFTVKGAPGMGGLAWFVADAGDGGPVVTGGMSTSSSYAASSTSSSVASSPTMSPWPAATAARGGASAPVAELKFADADGALSGASAPGGSSWSSGGFAGGGLFGHLGGVAMHRPCVRDVRGACLVVGKDYTLVAQDPQRRLRVVYVPPDFYDQSTGLVPASPTGSTPAERLRKALNGVAVQLITSPDPKAAAEARARLATEFPSLRPAVTAR